MAKEPMWCKKCSMSSDGPYCRCCGGGTVPAWKDCPYCKSSNTVSSKFCEQCGRPVQNGTGVNSPQEGQKEE